MGFGYSYTLVSGDTAAPPVMTGHATREADARRIVEQMLARDESAFLGLVRDLSSPVHQASRCRRSRVPGQFHWDSVAVPMPERACS